MPAAQHESSGCTSFPAADVHGNRRPTRSEAFDLSEHGGLEQTQGASRALGSFQRRASLSKLQNKTRYYFDSADYAMAKQSGNSDDVASLPPAQFIRCNSGQLGPSRLRVCSYPACFASATDDEDMADD